MSKNLNITVPRLGRNRLGVFFVRSPSFVDESGRRRVVQKSLRTKDSRTAKILALEYCLLLTKDIKLASDFRNNLSTWTLNAKTGEISADGEEDQKRLEGFIEKFDLLAHLKSLPTTPLDDSPSSALQVAISVDAGRPLHDLVKLHLEMEASAVKSIQTVHEKRMLLEDFMAVFGETTRISNITKMMISDKWIPVELKRPNKKHKGMTLSGTRLEKRRGYLSKFFGWAKTSGYYALENPMSVRMATKKQIRAQTKSYSEFDGDDQRKLFRAEYIGFMDKPDWYWAPLMALFSGARLSEICGLRMQAITLREDAKIFEILDGKTPDSKRVVPIHSTLINLGFWDYVQERRQQGDEFLFAGRSSPDAVAKALGRRWGQWVEACGIKDKRKVFHSFRSTVITDLHNAGAGAGAIRTISGHSSPGIEGVHGGYVRGTGLQTLVETIEFLKYPAIDFESLRRDDPTFAAYFLKVRAAENNPALLEKKRKIDAHLKAKAARLAGKLGKPDFS